MSAPVASQGAAASEQGITAEDFKVEKDCDLEALKTFEFDRVLSEGECHGHHQSAAGRSNLTEIDGVWR